MDSTARRCGTIERMTREDYEARYAEALRVVRDKIPRKIVGDPEITPFGRRLVVIDGTPCNDEIVFAEAWGKETALDIVAQRRESRW